jgi:hypothetical protein
MEWSLGPPWPEAKVGLPGPSAQGPPTGAPPPPTPTPPGSRSGGGRPRPPAKGGEGGVGASGQGRPSWASGPKPTRGTLRGSALSRDHGRGCKGRCCCFGSLLCLNSPSKCKIENTRGFMGSLTVGILLTRSGRSPRYLTPVTHSSKKHARGHQGVRSNFRVDQNP